MTNGQIYTKICVKFGEKLESDRIGHRINEALLLLMKLNVDGNLEFKKTLAAKCSKILSKIKQIII